MYSSPPSFSVDGILQARILERGWHSLLQGIFLTQGLNPGLPHCRRILYCLSRQGSPSHSVTGDLLWCLPVCMGIKSRGTPVSLFLSCIYLFIWLYWSQLQHTRYVSCGILDLVPWTGIKPRPLHWELRVLATGPPEKSQLYSDFKP